MAITASIDLERFIAAPQEQQAPIRDARVGVLAMR